MQLSVLFHGFIPSGVRKLVLCSFSTALSRILPALTLPTILIESHLYSDSLCNPKSMIRPPKMAVFLLSVSLGWLRQLKSLPAVQETWLLSLGQEDPLEKEIAIHSSILAWKIPWMELPIGLQSMG